MNVLYTLQIFLAIALQAAVYFALFPPHPERAITDVEPAKLLFNAGVLLMTLTLQWSLLCFWKKGRYIAPFYRWIKNVRPPRFALRRVSVLFFTIAVLFLSYLLFYKWNGQNVSQSTLWLFAGFFLARAVFEELIFRGYLYRLFLKQHRKHLPGAVLFQAAVFTALHNINPDTNVIRLINIFLGGTLLGLAAIRSFKAATLFHFAWNFLPGFVLGAAVSGYRFGVSLLQTNRPVAAWEDNPLSIAILTAAVFALSYFEYKTQRTPDENRHR